MVLSRLTKITGPGVATDTNWVGNNADFTGITTTATSFNIGVTTIHSNLIEAHNIKSTGIITATGGSFSGNVTAVDGTFSGNVSIAGTLTYEDVTNIDAVGIITAPALDVDDFLDVGSNIKLGNAGVITATSFVGDGSGLIGVASTDNIITGTAATFNTYPVDINAGMTVAGVSTFTGQARFNGEIVGSTISVLSGYSINMPDKLIHSGDSDTAIRFPADDTISFETAGSQHLRVASNGNIGIGTANNNPTSKLHIVVDGVGQGIHIANKENLYPTASTGYSDIRFSFRDYQTGGSSGAPAIIRGQSHSAGATSRSSKLIFLTSSSDGTNTPTEKMRIEYDGKIGIDNSSPDNKLSVYDVGYCGLELKSNRTTATDNIGGVHWKTQSTDVAYLQSLVDGTIRFRNTSSLTERLRIRSDGKVVIGTNYTGGTLSVTGNLITDDGTNGRVTIQADGTSTNQILSTTTGFGSYCNMKYQAADHIFLYGGTERLRITSGGAIGLSGTNYGSSGQVLTSGGSGSAATWSTISGTTINNNADNRIITGSGTANTLNGESGLTFNGTDLIMNTSGGRIYTTRTSGEAGVLIGSGNAGGATLYLDGDSNGDWSGGDYAYIRHNTSGHLEIRSTNPSDDGQIQFYTGTAATYYGGITADGRLSMNGSSNSRAIEINPGGNAGTIVLDRNGYITSMIRASDGGSNVAGGSGGGSRIHLAKTAMNFQTFPYTSNIGDAPTYTTRCSINTDGHFVPGANSTYDLGTSSTRWRNIYTNDLNLSNEGSTNSIDNTWGDWTLQEGESDVYMINNRSGKKFKIKMEEVL
jgi:hypothetical protein